MSHEPVRFGSDGELLSGKFCAYCGNQNIASDDYCQHCSAYIADQGPDLTARLARISRRAASVRTAGSHREDGLFAAQFDRFEKTLEKLDQSWQVISLMIASFLTPIDNRFAILRERYPVTMNLLFGRSSNMERKQVSDDTQPIVEQSSLPARLARIRRYASSASDVEQPESRWSMFNILFLGWLFGTAVIMIVLLFLAHRFYF
jgi:hypothetical protein